MKATETRLGPKGLVAVFEDLEAAKIVVEKMCDSGVARDKIELVTHDVEMEAPQVTTPKVHETTGTVLVDTAGKWGGVGAGTGLLVGLLTGNPGWVLGMAAIGGMTGALVGAMAGIDQAVENDSVNLPTLDQYQQMVRNGHCLVVVLGEHDDVMLAEAIMKEFPDIHRHLHVYQGHEFHEHPAKKI